ncbi:hypothetical protein ABL78_2258 [Leptomonas seymouri]|uniref:Cytoplasmic tRNA 2-thiolation protein 2 n=1 Tax=Leptomonas seymouri TaxID=5684 RepID=A0A0N1PDC5_LEPSE|nr:hypothetical protein ABL78_2258 [Leptomonas seymouri]|eukprot:KPI88654.1 hypothetical protein ABL78_2258 [Leptomonas seymouri]
MSQCFKCKQGIGTIVSRDGSRALYCTDCFLRYCSGAVRDNLFQRCFLACDTPVAVAVSGGPNSMLLLRELGQLRRKTQAQHHRPSCSQHSRSKENGADPPALSSSHSSASGGSTFDLLPFHLCEAELVIPPSPSAVPTTASIAEVPQLSKTATNARNAAIERVRSSMQEHFDVLLKLVQQQPPLWVYHDEGLDGSKQKRSMPARPPSAAPAVDTALGSAGVAEVAAARGVQPPVHLFERAEVRVFQFSDFLSPAYIAEVLHALHLSRLSLTDREALYGRIKRQVLCRAAQRVTDEYRRGRRTAEEAQAAPASSPHASASLRWYHLLLGDNAARCATAALEAVVTGAGGDGVVHDSAFRGLLHNVVCLRPMRTMLPKETVLCSRLHGIRSTYTPALRTGTSLRSMHHVLEHFVYTMISSYRTMIFNVLNTVQKLQVHPTSIQELVELVERTPDHAESIGPSTSSACTRKSKKAMPGRTAQQNQKDLVAFQPPDVYTQPSSLASAAAETGTHKNGVAERAAVQCCVCGCPATAPSPHNGCAAAEAIGHPADVVSSVDQQTCGMTSDRAAAQQTEHMSSLAVLDCFLCHACRSLLGALPASALGPQAPLSHRDGEQDETDDAARATPIEVLHSFCRLFQ